MDVLGTNSYLHGSQPSPTCACRVVGTFPFFWNLQPLGPVRTVRALLLVASTISRSTSPGSAAIFVTQTRPTGGRLIIQAASGGKREGGGETEGALEAGLTGERRRWPPTYGRNGLQPMAAMASNLWPQWPPTYGRNGLQPMAAMGSNQKGEMCRDHSEMTESCCSTGSFERGTNEEPRSFVPLGARRPIRRLGSGRFRRPMTTAGVWDPKQHGIAALAMV